MDKNLNRIIGKYVKDILLAKNMTQTDLAKAVQLPLSTVNDYIKGKCRMSYENMARIADYLEIDLFKLWHTALLKTLVVEQGIAYTLYLLKEILSEEDIIFHVIHNKDMDDYFVVLSKETYCASDIVCIYKHLERTHYIDYYKNAIDTDDIIGVVVDIIV